MASKNPNQDQIRYCRVVLILVECGTGCIRQVFITYLRKNGITVEDFLRQYRSFILKTPAGKTEENKEKLQPPPHQAIDVTKWDISLLACICDERNMDKYHYANKLPVYVKDISDDMRKLRNTHFHDGQSFVDQTQYNAFKGDFMNVLNRVSNYESNHTDFDQKMRDRIGEIEMQHSFLGIEECQRSIQSWLSLEVKLEGISQGMADVSARVESLSLEQTQNKNELSQQIGATAKGMADVSARVESLSSEQNQNKNELSQQIAATNKDTITILQRENRELKTAYSRLQLDVTKLREGLEKLIQVLEHCTGFKFPDIVEATAQCNQPENETLKEVHQAVVDKTNKNCQSSGYENLSEEQIQQINTGLEESAKSLVDENIEIKKGKNGSIRFKMHCKTIQALLTLFRDCRTGRMTERFKPLQNAIRRIPGLEDYTMTVVIEHNEYIRFIEELSKMMSRTCIEAGKEPTSLESGNISTADESTRTFVISETGTMQTQKNVEHEENTPTDKEANESTNLKSSIQSADILPQLKFEKELLLQSKLNKMDRMCIVADNFLVRSSFWRTSISLYDIETGFCCSQLYFKDNEGSFSRGIVGDVASVRDKMLVVALPFQSVMQYVRVTKAGEMQKEKKVPVKSFCMGITCNDDKLVLAYRDPFCIQIFNMNGSCVLEMGADTHCDLDLLYPERFALSRDHGTIYVMERSSTYVIALSMKGEMKAAVNTDTCDLYTTDIVVDRDGRIILCDLENSLLYLLRVDSGICTLIPSPVELNKPRCLTYHAKTNRLFVGDFDGVKVFDVKTTK